MIFKIESMYGNGKPCDNAYFDKKSKQWHVEINTLDELIEIVNSSYGVALFPPNEGETLYEICIDVSFIE